MIFNRFIIHVTSTWVNTRLNSYVSRAHIYRERPVQVAAGRLEADFKALKISSS